ncbi:hypothetical protein F5Y11DRAFT_313554, partial [Daldinia sp. FL1419]
MTATYRYSRQGCGDQSDQELFGILHSSGQPPPPPMSNQISMTPSPIRMIILEWVPFPLNMSVLAQRKA